mmetsp:Transcript_52985/g.118889  ORF Transcript_52985/g.118889 Transcript_52985/m.118889 type:complete len:180 (-) Transcript_52985:119-658(-)
MLFVFAIKLMTTCTGLLLPRLGPLLLLMHLLLDRISLSAHPIAAHHICAGWIVIVIKCWALTFVLSTLDAARYGWPCRVRRASLQLSTLSVEPQIIARWAEYLRRHLQVAREWTKAAIAQHRLLDTQLILTPSSVNDAMYSCMFAARSASIMKLSAIAVVAMVLGGWEEILRLWPSLGF